MNAKRLGLVFIFLVVGLITGYWIGVENSTQLPLEIYEEKLLDTSNLILVVDAIENESASDVTPILKAKLERNFTQIVSMYLKYGFQEGEYSRCVISRRIRTEYASGNLLSEYPEDILARVDDYLSNNCAGDPSSTNWVQ